MDMTPEKRKLSAIGLALLLSIGGIVTMFVLDDDDDDDDENEIEKYPTSMTLSRMSYHVIITSTISPFHPLVATPVTVLYDAPDAGENGKDGNNGDDGNDGGVVPVPDQNSDEVPGNYLGAMYYAYLSGGIFYDMEVGNTHMPYEDLSSGLALMLAKNKYIMDKTNMGVDMTTYVEFMHHGDPAFNSYEPNHEG